MALSGHFHPLLVHFPIALILIATVAKLKALVTRFPEWQTVAVVNVRARAFAVASAGGGWRIASSGTVEASPALKWHPRLGLIGHRHPQHGGPDIDDLPRPQPLYRITPFLAAAFVAVAGPFGAGPRVGRGLSAPAVVIANVMRRRV